MTSQNLDDKSSFFMTMQDLTLLVRRVICWKVLATVLVLRQVITIRFSTASNTSVTNDDYDDVKTEVNPRLAEQAANFYTEVTLTFVEKYNNCYSKLGNYAAK